MNTTPPKPVTPAAVTPPPLDYSPDVIARMKATGVDPVAAKQRQAARPRDQAENTWANVTDYYRRSTDMSSKVAAHQGADKSYLAERKRQPANEKWTAFDDMGASFKNSFVDLAQGVADFIPSTVDLAMSAVSNPSDDSWYRGWDKATDDYFAKAKYYVSPEAQAAVYDDKNGVNWRAVSGMMGSTMGFLTTTMIPMVGLVGRAGQAAEAVSVGSKILRTLTDPRIQSGAIGYLQAMPGYKEAAIQAGYTRNQAALIAPILSAAQSVLEFAGADALMKGIKLAPNEAMSVVKQLTKESAADAFKQLAGKPLTEETFRDVINQTGKGFFSRLANPEVRAAVLQNVKAGGASELVEEVVQQGAESAIQKMADIYYGYGKQGDETKDGKGFDPGVKQTLIGMGVGGIMGGAVGGSMGGMLGRMPSQVGQQTVWGLLDSNVRDLVNNHPDLDLENNKNGLTAYRITDKLLAEGKMTEEEHAAARQQLDSMAAVSQRLAKIKAEPPVRYALFNLDSQQKQWTERRTTEVDGPMQRLNELAEERAPGQWFPKPGLATLDLAEAQELIHQDLPRKAELASRIDQSISESVLDLMNPAKREKALASYKPMLDGLADEWENGPAVVDPAAPARPDQFNEGDIEDLQRTMDTPDGRFALSNGPNGREVFRVETNTDGVQADVSEDRDPVIGRFKGYTLPSKGRPVVTLHTINDETRHSQLLDAFDNNADATESYGEWRGRLGSQFQDNELDGLRSAEAQYQKEAADLPGDAPDWQKQDLAKKRNWLKAAMASRAADSGETRYGWSDWTSGYLAEPMQQAGITPEQMSALSTEVQSDVATALQSGDLDGAKALVNQPPTENESNPATSRADELSAQIAATAVKQQLVENAERATRKVLELSKVIEELEQYSNSGKHDADTEQRLVDAIGELTRALDEESDALSAYNSVFGRGDGSAETGTGESETGSNSATQVNGNPGGQAANQEGIDATGQGEGADVLAGPPQARDTSKVEPKIIDRQPQDLHEAILQFFTQGNRIRRSDLNHYGDPNWNKGARGGNPYLLYTSGDDKQVSLDTVARDIVVERLGRSDEEFDMKEVIQEIVDTIKSFSPTSTPKQQLIKHQQESVQMAVQDVDTEVEQATQQTSLEVLKPFMDGMDRAQVPNNIQDQIVNIIADNYVTADGLDWVGVMHLLRANGLFERYDDLRNSLLPMLDEIARQVPTTNAELRAEAELRLAEPRAAAMSNAWWQEMADAQAIPDSEYNAAIEFFYGDPAKQPESATPGDIPPGDSPVGATQEDSGVPDPADSETGEGGNQATDDQLQPEVVLSPVQQAQVESAVSKVDEDIAVIERHTRLLENQLEKLRKDVRGRITTGDLFAPTPAAPAPAVSYPPVATRPSAFSATIEDTVKVDNTPDVKPTGDVTPNTIIQLVPDINGYKGYLVETGPRVARLVTYRNYMIEPAFEALNSVNNPADVQALVTVKPARYNADGTVKEKGQVFYQQKQTYDQWRQKTVAATPQPELFAGESSGIEAQDAAKNKMADLERQIDANNERVKNLQQQKARSAEIVALAPEQAALFDAEDSPIIPEPEAEVVENIAPETISTDNEGVAAEEAIAELEAQEQAATDEEEDNSDGEEQLSVEQQAEADETLEKLSDFGQKVGGARKDTADRGFTLGKRAEDKTPGWARKYKVFQSKLGTFEVAVVNGHFMKTLQRGFATEAEAEAAIPLVEVSRNHRVYNAGNNDFAIYRVFSNSKTWTLAERFPTRDEAMRYLAKNAEEIITRKSPIVERPHLDSIQRNRPDVRGGKNATPQQFLDTFGFRGGEFGNWLAADERQTILNLAYDAFMDLATVLGVPPRALSMGGELSIGFGSRGKGLRAVAAHYETGRAVINLTKVRGAGSLAHEWFHAFDNYLAKQDGKAPSVRREDGTFDVPSKERAYFSHGATRYKSGIRKELSEVFDRVWNAISTKSVEKEFDVAKTDAAATRTRDNLAKGIADLRKTITTTPSYGRKYKLATDEQLALFDQLTDKLLTGEVGERKWVKKEKSNFGGDYYYDDEASLYAIYKQVTGRKVGDHSNVSGELLRHVRATAEAKKAKAGQTQTTRVNTDFVDRAKKLDAGRASAYWATPHELFARAFEGYLQDKLASGGESQYLVYGANNSFYAMMNEKPYAEGQERLDINEAMDQLFGVVQTREDSNGNALFYDITQPKPGRTAINAIFGVQRSADENFMGDDLDERQQYRTEVLAFAESQINEARSQGDTPRRRSALLEMRKAMKRFDAGKLSEADLMTTIDGIYARMEARNNDRQNQETPDRVRGADFIREKLLEAKRRGDLDEGGVDMAEWMLAQNPAVADEVGISIRSANQEQADQNLSGFYNPLAKIITLFKGSDRPTTAVHELLHHSERLMPTEVQAGIQKAYASALAKALKSVDPAVRTFAGLVVDGKTKEAVDMLKAGKVDYDAAYPLLNSSEFWAVNATDLLTNRFNSKKGWLARAGQWMNEFIEKAKGFFGLDSDAPIIAGLNAVLTPGTSTSISPMLAQSNQYAQMYGPRPTVNDQPARPIANSGATALATLATSFKENSPVRTQLLAQPAGQLSDYLRQTFEPMAAAIVQYAPGTPVANQLLKIRANGNSLFDPATGTLDARTLDALAAELVGRKGKGSEATGRLRDLLWKGSEGSGITKQSGYGAEPDVLTAYRQALTEKAIIDEDGNYEWPDVSEELRDSQSSVETYDEATNDGAGIRMLKGLVTSKFISNILPMEVIGKLLSLGESSSLNRITKTIHREWAERAAEVRLRRNHLMNELNAGLQGLSRYATPSGKVGDTSSSVKTYRMAGWENGKVKDLDLAIGDWMDIYFTIRTQLATTARRDPSAATSTVLADVDGSGNLKTTRTGINSQNQAQSGTYGYQYTAPGDERPKTLLIDRGTYADLESRLRAEHGNLLDIVDQLFADPVARHYLAGLYEVENGLSFPMEDHYFPTQAWQSAAERDVVPTVGGLLENARILRERKTPPLKVAGRDILARVSGYVSMEHRYIANSATRLNMTRWRQRNAASLDKAPVWLTKYLTNQENDLNDGGANSPDEESFKFEVGGVDLGLRAWMTRFSRSTFAFSLTTGPKQLLTHLNAYGMGIIENQYLRQSAGDLGRLAVDSYRLAKQNDATDSFGGELAEKKYLDELAQNPYMATIMDRLVGADEAYLGRPTMDDLKMQPANAVLGTVRHATHTIANYGLRWVRASDRAVILSFWKAAQYQVADKIAAGTLVDGKGTLITDANSDAALREVARLTTELTYATNTMSGDGNATPLQRNKGLAGAMLGLYSGQQQRLGATCVAAINDYLKARHLGDPGADKLRDRAIWTATNLLLFNAVGVGLINILFRSLTGLLDDKPLPTPEEALADLSLDVTRGLVGTVPSVPSELIIAASTWVDGPKWSDDVLGYAPGQSFQRVVEGMVAATEYVNAKDEETANKRWNAMTSGLVDGGAHLVGIPSQVPKLIAKMTKSETIKESDW